MAIIEAGLIVNGMPVIRSEYFSIKKNVDPFLRTSLFTAIQTYAKHAFKDHAEEMKLKKYNILIRNISLEDGDQKILYAVLEKGTDKDEVKKRMQLLHEKITSSQVIFDSAMMSQEIRSIKRMIDSELKDLCLRAADRAKKIFG